MKRKSLVVLFITALIATNVFLSIRLYSANRQIAVLTVESEKFRQAAASLQAALAGGILLGGITVIEEE